MCSTKWQGGEDGKKDSVQKRDLERLSGYAGGFQEEQHSTVIEACQGIKQSFYHYISNTNED